MSEEEGSDKRHEGREGGEEEGEEEHSSKRGRTESGNFSFARRNVKAANEQGSAWRGGEGERHQLHTPVTDYTVTGYDLEFS